MPSDAISQVLIYSFFFSMPSRQTLRFSGGNREDKENRTSMVTMIQEDSDDDGPILYRDDDDDEMEDEGKHNFAFFS